MGGVLQRLGVDFGENLMPAIEGVNDKGFYENIELVDLHEKILDQLGYRWFDVRALPVKWWTFSSLTVFKNALVELVKRDFGGSKLWGLKDPRMCRLLPLWISIFDQINSDARFVHIYRHPNEVAKSLVRRDGLDVNVAYIAWLWHVLEAERLTRSYSRVFVSYQSLIEDWRKVAESISVKLQIEWPFNSPSAKQEIDEFIDADMRHNKTEAINDSDGVAALAQSLYKKMVIGEFGDFNLIYDAFIEELAKLSPYLDGINEIQKLRESDTHCRKALMLEKNNAVAQIKHRDQMIIDLQKLVSDLQEVVESRSPLYKLFRLLIKSKGKKDQ